MPLIDLGPAPTKQKKGLIDLGPAPQEGDLGALKPESFVGPPYAASGEIRPLQGPPPVEGIRPIADPDDIILQAAPTPTVAPVKRPKQTIGAMVPFGMLPGSGFGDPLGLSEITTAIREMVAPTTPYTEKEATRAYKEIPRTLENVGVRALTLGGLAGPLMGLKPSELRAALDEDIRDSAGFGEALAPALGETTLLAVEWGYLYPKLFKLVGAAPRVIGKIPGVARGAKALKSLGGIEKLATKYPRLYNRVSKVLGAFTKGATVGTITALPEALGEELPAGEVLKHTGKSAAIMGGIAGTFQVLSQVDTARYVKQLRNSLIKASNQRFSAKIAEIKRTIPLYVKVDGKRKFSPLQGKTLKGLTGAKTNELRQIDNIVSAAEAQLIGLKSGKLYQKGQGMVESPQQAADRFIRQGIGARASIEGEPLLKKGLGQAKPFIEMPTTRAGEVRESLAEAAKVARHPVEAVRKAVARRPSVPAVPKAVTPPPVVPGAPAAEVTPEKRTQAIDFVKDVLSQDKYAALDEKTRTEIGQMMLAEQGVEVTAEELAETPATEVKQAPQPTPTGQKAEIVPVAKGKPLAHPLAQGKSHQELADMDMKEYADTIHNLAADKLDKVKQRQKELREQGGDYTKTEEWQQLKEEQAQLFEITGGSALPQSGMAFHERQVEREAVAGRKAEIAPVTQPEGVGVTPVVLKPDLEKPKTSIEKGMVQQMDEMAKPEAVVEAEQKPLTLKVKEKPPVVDVIKSPELEYKDEYRDYLQSEGVVRKVPDSGKIPIGIAARIRQEVEDELRGAKAEPAPPSPAEEVKKAVSEKPPLGDIVIKSRRTGQEVDRIAVEKEMPEPQAPEDKLVKSVFDHLVTGEKLDAKDFFAMADEAYGGTRAEGKYGPSDAYDALEVAVNKALLNTSDPSVDVEAANLDIEVIEGYLNQLPSQTNRSGEKDLFQQFSTPPHYSYAVAWAANITPDDIVLEPSAGTGSLAVHAINAGAKVNVNELSERRRKLLETFDFNKITAEDAEQIHNILPEEDRPTVILMNPPFSTAAQRMGTKKVYGTDLKHIDAALSYLQEGGRLVAIMGRPRMGSEESATFNRWKDKIGKNYNIRANVFVNRGVYKKYGTSFPTRILIIDKTGPTDEKKILGGTVDNISDLLYHIAEVRNDRKKIQPTQAGKAEQKPSPEAKAKSQPAAPIQPSTPVVDVGEQRPGRPVEGRPAETQRPSGPDVRVEAGEGAEGTTEGRAGAQRPAAIRDVSGRERPQPTGRGQKPGPQPETVTVSSEQKRRIKEHTATEAVFEPYQPAKFKLEGAKKHPASLVESTAMAAVDPPDLNYELAIPQKLIDSGKLSDIQLEAIAYAGQAHEVILPDGNRKGYFIGDGTGVGKGREVAGIILDNWRKGRTKSIWFSANKKLFKDAKRDWKAIGQDPVYLFDLGGIKATSEVAATKGIMYSTYDVMKSQAKVKEGQRPRTRMDQIVEWLGEDFDGVIVFDESHKMANAIETRGTRGRKKPSARALAGIELQNRLPKARVVYVSATGATEVSNLAYATRLGLWGPETPFPTPISFIGEMLSGGIANMELIARDLKALGLYNARQLSFNDGTKKGTVVFDRIEHKLSGEQRQIYNKLAEGWQVTLQNFESAMEVTGANLNGRAKGAAKSAYWGAHQRFFNQIITAMQTPSVIKSIEKDLEKGRSAVIQLTSTNEADQERALAKLGEEESLDDFDITPRDMLMQLIEHSFPVNQYETYIDENGNERSRLVVDSQDKPVINREAVTMRERLLDEIGSIRVPESPLDMIIRHFGHKNVSEVTGRARRVVTKEQTDGSMKKVIEKRGKNTNQTEIDAFMNGKKRVLIFSEAGGTGASYHADNESKNTQQRVHYLLQPGWRADTAIQGLGRTHRSNQAQAPIYKLVTTDLKGQKRFISSIARRLSQLGALTRGERKAGESGLFTASDNLESQEARDALRGFFHHLMNDDLDFSEGDFTEQTGLVLRDQQGNPKTEMPQIQQFLNRLLSLKVDMQNQVFETFQEMLDARVEQAIADGTLDQGMESYKADKVEKVSEQVVYSHPDTNSETRYVQLKAYRKNNPVSWEQIQRRTPKKYVKSRKGTVIYAVTPARAKTDATSGRIIDQYRLTPPSGTSHFAEQTRIDYHGGYDEIKGDEAGKMWREQFDKVPEFHSKTEHFLTGLILPIWDKIRGTARIYRIVTTEGEEMIGRTITPNALSNTLRSLGATQKQQLSSKEAGQKLLNNDITVELSNQWKLKYSLVQGEKRIEIVGPSYLHEDELKSLGVFGERIQYSKRYFVPSDKLSAFLSRWPIVDVSHLSQGFTPDPIVEGEAAGKPGFAGFAGRPGGKVPKPWLTDEKVESPNPKIRSFYGRTLRSPYSRKVSTLLAKIDAGLRESFEYAHHITKTPANAIYVDMIRTMPEVRRSERERAVRDILVVLEGDGTVSALDSVGLNLLRQKIFTQDLLSEAEIDRSVSGDFSLEELEAENERIDALIEKVPSVKKAFEARQKLWKSVSADLLERGVLDAESAKNQAYVRHFVLDLAEKNGPTGFKKKRLSAPFRAYSKHRKGSKRDISTDYLEVEVRALADIYADNAVEDVANKIAELADKRKMYAAMARAENFQNLVGGSDNVKRILELRANLRETARDRDSDTRQQRKAWIEELIDLDPTYPFRKRIAMHMGKFKKVTEGTDFEIEEDSVLFKELARAAKEQAKEPAGLAARGVFKAMADRTRLIKLALGKDYLTAEKVALRDDYVEYFYLRPNLFYRAQTITQAQIAAFVENTAEEAGGILSIPVEKMNEALVLGRRKGWLIPSELADQLNDLPVNKRNPHVSFSKPFVMFWKRWILRYHLLRYNTRNLIGDAERFWTSGQEHAIKYIPKAVKVLITKEGEYYDASKPHGVFGSTLWHEMNDVSKIKEFEKFKDFSKPKTFKAATKKILMAPLTVISRIGSAAQNLTQFREDILRMAVFMANYDKLKEGKKVRHWAGKIADIDAIAKIDKAMAASKISRETLGDYGKFTPFENDVLRQGLMPFYSWFKINTLFWPHVVLEAAKEGGTGTAIVRSIPRVGLNVARWLVRALFVYGGMYWWNHRDEEAEDKEASLPYWQRSLPHLNIGDYTLWGQTALSDFAEWTDMNRLSGIMWRRDAGFITWKEAGLEASRVIAEAPVNKVYQALSPFMKAPITAISGLETYPSVFRPRQVAPKASRKSLERAMLGIMGSDVKRFHQTLKGDRKFEDTLYAYFAGWIVRPTDVDTFIADVKRSKAWTTLKTASKGKYGTGRRAGQAKKGREVEFQERKARIRAIQKRVIAESER